MRDPNRIRPFLNRVAEVWEKHPDLRFGQLILNVINNSDRLWNIEERGFLDAFDAWEARICEHIKKETIKRENAVGSPEDKSGFVFSVGSGRGDNYFDIWFNASDSCYYMMLNACAAHGDNVENKRRISTILMEFTKWMLYKEYAIDEEIDLSEYINGSICFKRGYDSIEKAYAVFKAYAIGYMPGLPLEEFNSAVNHVAVQLPQIVSKCLEDSELKELLDNVPNSYINFVLGTINTAHKSDAYREAIIQFITDHPEANASDVVEYTTRLLDGR